MRVEGSCGQWTGMPASGARSESGAPAAAGPRSPLPVRLRALNLRPAHAPQAGSDGRQRVDRVAAKTT